jgi:hypothetical protein
MDLPKLNRVKGMEAARLRQRKFDLLERLTVPPDGLPGSLSLTHTRCGTPTCHCAQGEGHPVWQLTFRAEGTTRVERIPTEWVEDVRRRVEEGKAFREAVAEVFTANAELLALEKKQRGRKRKKRK